MMLKKIKKFSKNEELEFLKQRNRSVMSNETLMKKKEKNRK